MMSGNSSISEVEPFGFDSDVGQSSPVYRRKTRDELALEASSTRAMNLTGLLNRLQAAVPTLLTNWETPALFAVIGVIVLSLSAVLWPMPTAEFALRSLPVMSSANNAASMSTPGASSVMETGLLSEDETVSLSNAKSGDATSGVAAGRGSAPSRKTHWHHTPKKPKHPPIQSLNRASLAKLQLLPGIGPAMAQRIVDYRKSHGPFTDISQVMDVKGIGPKKFEKMKPFLKL